MARWNDALELQLELIHQLATPKMKRQTIHFIKKMIDHGEVNMPGIDLSDEALAGVAARNYIDQLRGHLNLAETVWVADDMMQLVMQGANSLPPHVLHPSDLPFDRGFVRFERPLNLTGTQAEEVTIHAFTWWVHSGKSLQAAWFSHRDDKDFWSRRWREEYDDEIVKEMFSPWILDTLSGWTFGRDWQEIGGLYTDDKGTGERVRLSDASNDARLMISLFLLMKQKVGTWTITERAERKLRRRAERVAPNFGDITVVDLRKQVPRKPVEPDHEPNEVEWSHRWVVDGHWRQQYYPSEGRHKPIWIAPFVKGPEDKPLVVKDRIYRVIR